MPRTITGTPHPLRGDQAGSFAQLSSSIKAPGPAIPKLMVSRVPLRSPVVGAVD